MIQRIATHILVKQAFINLALVISTFFMTAVSYAAPYVVADHFQVETGGSSSCAIDDNGVHCWGGNWAGQNEVPSLTHPIVVSAGQTHICAIDDNGVHCWGGDWAGQTDVPSLNHPVTVSAGYGHTCALDVNGVYCWGDNWAGQTDVPSLNRPVTVSAGTAHTCALDDTGVHCWGYNSYGQADVPSLTHPVAVSAGDQHTCALDDNGVHCWGDNDYGQTDVPSLTNPVMVSAANDHTCALDDNGVHCWGWGFNLNAENAVVPNLTNPIDVSAGGSHSCALDDNGVYCWGFNASGQTDAPCLTFNGVLTCPVGTIFSRGKRNLYALKLDKEQMFSAYLAYVDVQESINAVSLNKNKFNSFIKREIARQIKIKYPKVKNGWNYNCIVKVKAPPLAVTLTCSNPV